MATLVRSDGILSPREQLRTNPGPIYLSTSRRDGLPGLKDSNLHTFRTLRARTLEFLRISALPGTSIYFFLKQTYKFTGKLISFPHQGFTASQGSRSRVLRTFRTLRARTLEFLRVFGLPDTSIYFWSKLTSFPGNL